MQARGSSGRVSVAGSPAGSLGPPRVPIPLGQDLGFGGMDMTDRHIRRWALLGALVSAALLTPACDRRIPKEGSDYEGVVNEAQKVETRGGGQQGAQPPATGGAGLQQQQQGGAQPNDVNLFRQQQLALARQGQQQAIGAPGYSSPRESTRISPRSYEPQPQLRESAGNRKADRRLMMPGTNQSNSKR